MIATIFKILYLLSPFIPLATFFYLVKFASRTKASKAFMEVQVFAFLWLLSELLMGLGFVPDFLLVGLTRLMFFLAVLVTWMVLRFVLIFFGLYKKNVNWFLPTLFFIIPFLFIVTIFSDFVVVSILPDKFFWEIYYVTGPLFPAISVFIALPLLLSLGFILYNYFQVKSEKTRRQLKYFGVGIFSTLTLGVFTNLISPLMGYDVPRLANFTALILVACLFGVIYFVGSSNIPIKEISFKFKIFLIFFSSLVVLMIFLYTFVVYVGGSIYERGEAEKALLFTKGISLKVENLIDDKAKELIVLSEDGSIRKDLQIANSRYQSNKKIEGFDFKEEEQEGPNFKNKEEKGMGGDSLHYLADSDHKIKEESYLDIYLTSKYGFNLSSTDYSYLNEEKIKNIRENKVLVTRKSEGKKNNKEYFLISKKITDANNRFLGAITGVIDLNSFSWWSDVSGEVEPGSSASVQEDIQDLRIIEKRQGEIVYSRNNKRKIDQDILEMVRSDNSHYSYKRDKYYQPQDLYVFSGVDSDYLSENKWSILLNYDVDSFLGYIDVIKRTVLIVMLIISVLAVAVFYYMIKVFFAPLEKLQEGVKKIEKGDMNYKIEVSSDDEIGRLSKSFNQMVESIKKSREEIDKKVESQTKQIVEQRDEMDKQKKAILNILEDVEEEKEKVEQERNRIRAMLHSIGDGVFVINNNRELVLFNKMAEQISGYSSKEVLGKKYDRFLKFVNEDGNKDAFVEDAFAKEEITFMAEDAELISKDGKNIPVSDSCSPVKNDQGKITGAVVVFRDVTKEREIDKAKTEFVSLASHQLRTPLSTISWYAEMLLNEDVGKINEDQKEFLQEVYTGNRRMVNLVNSLLNVSRIELGTLGVDPEPLDFKEIAESILKELSPSIKEKKLKIERDYDKKIPKIEADYNLVRIVFQNLLSNSVKYTPEEGEVSISLTKQSKYLLIKVSDSGYGIPKEEQDKIFTKLFRANNIAEKDAEGSGLGLYIVKSIIDQVKGKIWFKSKKNKGTTFFVKLPLSGMEKKEGSRTLNQ